MTRTDARIALVALVLAATVTGCGRRSAHGAGLTPVMVVAPPYVSNAPIFIAQDEGFFADEHLAVEIVELNRAQDGMPSLVRGSIDVIAGAISASAINAIARSGAVKAVAEKGHVATGAECTNQALLVRRDLIVNGVFTPPRRPLILASNPVTYSRLYTEMALAGAQPPIDIASVETVDIPESLLPEAFRAGRIDAAPAAEPWITAAVDRGFAVAWRSATDFIPGFQHSFLYFGPRLLDPRSDLGDRFLRAYLRGVDRLLQGDMRRTIDIVVSHTRLDPALLAKACWPEFSADGRVDPATLSRFQDWATSRGLIDRRVTMDEFWTPRFVEAAQARRRGPP